MNIILSSFHIAVYFPGLHIGILSYITLEVFFLPLTHQRLSAYLEQNLWFPYPLKHHSLSTKPSLFLFNYSISRPHTCGMYWTSYKSSIFMKWMSVFNVYIWCPWGCLYAQKTLGLLTFVKLLCYLLRL